jgi:hypothetical protein
MLATKGNVVSSHLLTVFCRNLYEVAKVGIVEWGHDKIHPELFSLWTMLILPFPIPFQ